MADVAARNAKANAGSHCGRDDAPTDRWPRVRRRLCSANRYRKCSACRLVEQQLSDAGAAPQALILEPAGRNTAPAFALAAIAAGGGADALLVMPSDHVIGDIAAIDAAMPLVNQGWLVTFGITPDAPETGYGWIQIGDTLQPGVNRVTRFVEKPPLDKAQAMLASGDHAWNGGIFLFRADAYLEGLAQFEPGILIATRDAMDKGAHRRRTDLSRRGGFRRFARRLGRLRGHGEGRSRGSGAGRHGLERRGKLGRATRDQRHRRCGKRASQPR